MTWTIRRVAASKTLIVPRCSDETQTRLPPIEEKDVADGREPAIAVEHRAGRAIDEMGGARRFGGGDHHELAVRAHAHALGLGPDLHLARDPVGRDVEEGDGALSSLAM